MLRLELLERVRQEGGLSSPGMLILANEAQGKDCLVDSDFLEKLECLEELEGLSTDDTLLLSLLLSPNHAKDVGLG